MQLNVTNKANARLKTVCIRWLLVVLVKISWETAREKIKTTRGSKKAMTTLTTTEGPSIFPN
jgi:hypothetical protein